MMVRKKVKDPKVDTELVYALAKTSALGELEEFISGTNCANLTTAGERCFDEGLYEAAKVRTGACSDLVSHFRVRIATILM